jgi:demethylmenaquinone methyltransferase / 2-methoxy-6-polyprenyl-1,4-benzoquinol methylase
METGVMADALTDKTPTKIAGMFDAIAGRYDLLNTVLSVGIDRYWRARAVRSLRLTGRERVLDLCTGTADVALALAKPGRAKAVVGIDFSGKMLRLAREKVRRAAGRAPIGFARGDAMRLPLPSGCLDAVTIAFGIRNVLDPAVAIREMHRVMAPGGRLAILEFSQPTMPVFRQFYGWYNRHVLPRIGRILSHHQEAYTYLPESVSQWPSPDAFAALIRTCGFDEVRGVPLTFGSVFLHTGIKR